MSTVSIPLRMIPFVGDLAALACDRDEEGNLERMLCTVRMVATLSLFVAVCASPGALFLLMPLCVARFSVNFVVAGRMIYQVCQQQDTSWWHMQHVIVSLFFNLSIGGGIFALSIQLGCPLIALAYEGLFTLLTLSRLLLGVFQPPVEDFSAAEADN